jgi:uncharacterized protein
MHSCIYEGYVRHRRFLPVRNEFRYRLFLMFLDLDELAHLFDGHSCWSLEKFNIAWFRRQDHLGDPQLPLDQAVKNLVEERTGERPEGPIRLLTHLRYFGHCFNPASFYYCYDRAGRRVETVVAEVHNTPWHEEHCYVLGKALSEHPVDRWKRYRFAKAFHVSPFMDMDIQYDVRFREPGEFVSVHFINTAKGVKIFDATLHLDRKELDAANLTRVLIRYPAMTIKVVTLIHWQALRLWLKGAPFFTHPTKRSPRT